MLTNISHAISTDYQSIYEFWLEGIANSFSIENYNLEEVSKKFRRNFDERNSIFNFWVAVNDSGDIMGWQSPVSYTHLDVYKRQGYNYLLVYINKNKFYFNLNANYSSIRNFNPKKISTTNFVTNSTLGNVPVQKIDSSISYYTSIPNRANAISCDLNLAYFFFKQNFGLDFGVTAGVNDPLDNNVNARFGIYIPFTAGDKIVYVEPILKFNKLFSSAGNEFLKDNFSFGFNVSVALPDFLKPNK